MFNIGLPELVVIVLIGVTVGVTILCATRICAKTGYPAWLGVIIIVPGGIVILAFFLAFVKWPIERELEITRRGGPVSR